MVSLLHRHRYAASFVLLALFAYAGNLAITRHPVPADWQAASLYIDLVLVVPAFYYLFISRTGHGPAWAILPLAYLGAFVAWHLSPVQPGAVLWLTGHYPALVAGVGGTMLGWAAMRGIRAWPATGHLTGEARVTALARSMIPNERLARVVGAEWLGLYYAFVGWRRPALVPDGARPFSYHRKSGDSALFIAAAVFAVPETVVLHLLLFQVNPKLAWVVTAISIYCLYMGPAQAAAMRKRPVLVHADRIELRFGILCEATVPFANLRNARAIGRTEVRERERGLLRTALGGGNVLLVFEEPITVHWVMGITRQAHAAEIHLDEPAAFLRLVESAGGSEHDTGPPVRHG